jgi:hypothetical protein
MQPSANSNNTNNTLSFRHTASSTLQLVVAFIDDKFLNGSTQPLANNFWQCRSFVNNLNKCQMEIDKTETNNFQQCQLFFNVSIDLWQHKCQMEINKTQTNNSWQCRSFVNVLIDSWQQKCRMEIDKNEMNNFRQCRSFVDVSIDLWQHKCQIEINKTETKNFRQCRLFVNVSIDSWQHTYQMEINKNEMKNSWQCRSFIDKMIFDLFFIPNREGARAVPITHYSASEGDQSLPSASDKPIMFSLTTIHIQWLIVEFIKANINVQGSRAPSTTFPTMHNRKSKFIVASHDSKTFLHFSKSIAIFCEGDRENANNGNDLEDDDVVVWQKSNLPSLLSLTSAISTQAALDASAPLDTLAATASFGQISLIDSSTLSNHWPIGLIGFIGLGLVGFIGLGLDSLVSISSLIGHNCLNGVIGFGLVSLVGLLGLSGINGLIRLISLFLVASALSASSASVAS